MPALERVLRDLDPGLLRVIARQWGLDLTGPNPRAEAEALRACMLQPELAREMVETLPAAARAALDTLHQRERELWSAFQRRHGALRVMGSARRDREQPWQNDPSPVESLYYRGLIATAFFDEAKGPQEFVFIPDDLRPLIPALPAAAPSAPGAPAPAPEQFVSAADQAPDDLTTLLAYLQVAPVRLEPGGVFPARQRQSLARFLRWPEALDFYTHLALGLGLAAGQPLKVDPARARPFLEASRPEQVASLAPAWRDSAEWNDLRRLPGLTCEGGWRNDPLAARQAVLDLLRQAPAGRWWSLEAFVAAVRERQPDFQRPGGDYDSWYIRDTATQAYLRGFEHWERVDGALVRWLIGGPLFWLGLVEVDRPGLAAGAFQITPYGAAFLGQAEWPAGESAPAPLLHVSAEGVVRVPASASRYDRFQVARVTNWLPPEGNDYLYRLAPASLRRAGQQGIKPGHILGFLQKASGGEGVPPALAGALHRWERSGADASLRETVVLRLKNRELLETLRRTPGVRRYLHDVLGPETVEVRPEDLEPLRQALAELGILAD